MEGGNTKLSLAATFKNSADKKHRWRMKNADPNRSPEEIKTSLEKLSAINLFEKAGVGLFQDVVSAKFVERTVTPIFDKSKEPSLPDTVAESERSALQIADSEANSAELLHEITVEERIIQSGIIEQRFELPAGIDPNEINEEQTLSLVLAVMPEGGTLEDIYFDEAVDPAKIVMVVKVNTDQ